MKHVARLGLSIWSRGHGRTRQAGGFRSHVGRRVPSSTNDLRFHRGPIMSVAIPAVEPRPARYLVGGDSIVHEWSSFSLLFLPVPMSVYIHTYIYTLAASSEQITFSNFSKCCVFDISTRTFSDRYQLMETMFCVFCLGGYGLVLCFRHSDPTTSWPVWTRGNHSLALYANLFSDLNMFDKTFWNQVWPGVVFYGTPFLTENQHWKN